MMKNAAQRLAAIELVDTEDNPVILGSAWKNQPALVVFIRHFG
jgi:hypothetical protein